MINIRIFEIKQKLNESLIIINKNTHQIWLDIQIHKSDRHTTLMTLICFY